MVLRELLRGDPTTMHARLQEKFGSVHELRFITNVKQQEMKIIMKF
jgi:hypothetical protein